MIAKYLTTEKMRWAIAHHLDKTSLCWSDLVSWVLDPEAHPLTGRWRGVGRAEHCELVDGHCYCGKVSQ